MARKMVNMDGNAAVSHVAHAVNDVIAIYPITPSSPMAEVCDEKSARGEKNIWGIIPSVTEMQSEGGASGAVHGALSTGAMTTTFTASQGLLLMIPNMYKIAGELTPTVFHVSARALAAQGLSIFGDHSDVMACRQTGFAMLCSNTVQEAMDMALIAQASTLRARVPFLHFFDGFRTSHEIQKIEALDMEDIKAMIDDDLVIAHRKRGLSPDHPTIKGTAQNPDVYFQGREVANKYYAAVPAIVQEEMDKFAKIVGRQYKIFQYYGAEDAEKVIVIMGSGADVCQETIDALKGEKIGVMMVRLFNPFSAKDFIKAMPKSVKKIAVLDRTKEPGALGEPLYLNVVSAYAEALACTKCDCVTAMPTIVGGRYGLGSKEFTPAMVKGVYDELSKDAPMNHFVVGIKDDVLGKSIDYDKSFDASAEGVYQAMFFGLGSDGTVGANKNSIKIIGNLTDNYTQAYFVYDSKKAGSITTSHLRFGKNPIKAPYLITSADFVACHNEAFIDKYDMLKNLKVGGTFLLTSDTPADKVWDTLPIEVQQQLIDKKAKFFVIDALPIAEKLGLGARINVIMQTAFFKISNIIPLEDFVKAIKDANQKSYGKKGDAVVKMNNDAVDLAIDNVFEVAIPDKVTSTRHKPANVPADAPEFVKQFTSVVMANEGDILPISAMSEDGTFPVGTTKYEKRNIAFNIPQWDPEKCIQCGRCALYCPHAAIRLNAYDPKYLEGAPATFKSTDAKAGLGKAIKDAGYKFTVQVGPLDCTGCGVCAKYCLGNKDPEKPALKMVRQAPLRDAEEENFNFFLNIPEPDQSMINIATVQGSQMLKPLFEFSGACAGCGETAYVKLVSQLFGDRAVIANATGCSSIYGGNLPTTPYTTNAKGRGPAWSNSLFEDNAEFGMGYRLTIDKFNEMAKEYLNKAVEGKMCDADLAKEILEASQKTNAEIDAQRERVAKLKSQLKPDECPICKQLYSLADYLVRKSVWIFGGDGWAYDIGYGGLDHVVASNKNVNILVLDTEVYSNTGGQMSKATPRGAIAKFAAAGKNMGKKDLGLICMSYGTAYVAAVSQADPAHLVKTMIEAEAYDGPSIIIAYSHCINHGISTTNGLAEQQKALDAGYWLLYSFNPDAEGNKFKFNKKPIKSTLAEFAAGENRFKQLKKLAPESYDKIIEAGQRDIEARIAKYDYLAAQE